MYQNFIGIDISKNDFAVAIYGNKDTMFFSNNEKGFTEFFKTYKQVLSNSLITLETTGGYECELLRFVKAKQISAHRANTRKVKHFIRSFGTLGKSDSIDAKALALYGKERHASLELYTENPGKYLQKLTQRRQDIKQMLVQEKNRLKAPDQEELKLSFKKIIAALEQELHSIDQVIEKYCQQYPDLNAHRNVIETVNGIGKVISVELLALLPELGKLNRKKIASLAGLAPHPYESGKKIGYRPTRGGRENIKAILFMAALTAARSKSSLGDFYNRLVNNGKPKMVAIVALMRKILITANARLREFIHFQSLNQHG